MPLVPPSLQAHLEPDHAVQLSANTMAGLLYQVQFTTDLADGLWLNLGMPFLATNSSSVFNAAANPDPQRFYRMELLPPQ